ncbi:hypothetical protein QYF61_007071 [Mycteria americana]|uniref:ribonuclease H n=1 Tax=Mycteria americana TaxID=33587 RepID=A0AAN7RWU3_MYCAM|nr:hypothetical protein QYF61_007071 [Mycteria americana]
MKLQATLLATAIAGNSAKGRGRGWNQCAYCREDGHWKNECPKRKPITQGRGSTLEADLIIYIYQKKTAWKAQFCLLTVEQQENINIPEEILDAVIPTVWATKRLGRAKNAVPVKIELKSRAQLVRKRQYPIKLEARIGLEPLINNFVQYGLLRECQSEYNTPIFQVRKPQTQEYQLVQDLREIKQITGDVHPVLPNLYTLLSSIPENNVYFTLLDLKDAFFCIPPEEESQKFFVFHWENPTMGRKVQLCWTYVDDILIGTDSERECRGAIIDLLNLLGFAGYRVSQKKAQIVQTTVEYLGFEI